MKYPGVTRLLLAALGLCLASLGAAPDAGPSQPEPADKPAAGGKAAPADKAAADRAALEKEFAEALTGAELVGRFTVDGGDEAPKEEKYTIVKVTKLRGDLWTFLSRIQFGGKDVTVPLVLPVRWAGDTPVISVTDTGIPGLGTYTARVLIYRDQYAGTWSGRDHGGHLWGKIRRAGAADEKAGGAKAGERPKGTGNAAQPGEAPDDGGAGRPSDAEKP